MSDPIKASKSWQSLFPYPANEICLERGHALRYVDQGQGDPILMVHGNPTWSFYFYPLIRELHESARCLAVDHMGCGRSDKPQEYNYTLDQHVENLGTLVERLDLRRVTLVAHDWGGAIGMGAVRLAPERFSRIVLLNTGAFPPPFFPWRIRACRMPWLGTWGVRRLNLFARAALVMASERPGGITGAEAEGLLAPYDSWANRVAIDRFVRDIPISSDQPTWKTLQAIEDFLPQAAVPKLLIWGLRDWCFRPECLARFRRHWPDAEVVQFEDAGHYVMLDKPAETVAAIRKFLKAPHETKNS